MVGSGSALLAGLAPQVLALYAASAARGAGSNTSADMYSFRKTLKLSVPSGSLRERLASH